MSSSSDHRRPMPLRNGAQPQRSWWGSVPNKYMVLCFVIVGVLSLSSCGGATSSAAPDKPLILKEDGRSTLGRRQARVSSGARTGHARQPASMGTVVRRRFVDAVVAAGPGRLLQLVPLAPVFNKRRRFAGFKIVRIHDNSARVLRYGVRPGDVLVSVNGQRILKPDHMLKLFKLVKNASELHIRVRRDGQPVQVRIPIVDENESRRPTR